MSKPDLLSPHFLQTLREKCFACILGLHGFYDVNGKRMRTKRLTSDPLFRAVWYYRIAYESYLQRLFQEFQEGVPLCLQEPLPELHCCHAALLISKYLQAVGTGDAENLRYLADLVELNSRCHKCTNIFSSNNLSGLPWRYFIGLAALDFLKDGVVPMKEDVIGRAIRRRAKSSLPLNPRVEELTNKIQEWKKKAPKQWRREFRDMGLSDLLSR